MGQQAEKDKTERVTGQGRETRDSQVESNHSPEIPDRGNIRHPWPPFGGSINHKISPDTNLHEQKIHKHRTQNFRRTSPLLKKST